MFSSRHHQRVMHPLVGVLLSLTLAVMVGCGTPPSSSVASTYRPDTLGGGAGPAWGLPYRSGTRVIWGQYGLHGHNYRSVPGFQLLDPTREDASIDLLSYPGESRVEILPLAHGRVISVWPTCHLVLVDHGYDMWTIYLHITPQVSAGQVVDPTTALGRTILPSEVTDGSPCFEQSNAEHVHFAFLQYVSGPANGWLGTARYVGMPGHVLCGHEVTSDGRLDGLATLGAAFTVPNCGNQPNPPPNAQPTNTPRPAPTNTPPPAASTCSTPWLQSPSDGSSFGQSDSIDLSWSTDCAQSYAELTGGPYGTLNFGGWQGGTSAHVGTMWPGTYSWHVMGMSRDGVQTNWSSSWSFSVNGGPPPPTATPTPVPQPTATPVPQPTSTPTPCPYQQNYGQFPTFYAQPNLQGQSVTFTLSPGQDQFFTFPNWLQQNLESFTDPYGAFHIVTFHTPDHGGNMAHWDATNYGPLSNTDGYAYSASVEIYFHRTC